MLKLFDRYVLQEVLPPFGLGLLVYTFVLLMNQILLLAEMFISHGVGFRTVVEILAYLIPSILAFTLPMAVLMGVLAGLSRLSTDHEITAFKELGISFLRLLRPLLLFAAAGWLLTSVLTLYLAPRANYKWIQTLTGRVLSKVQVNINPREFNERFPRMVLFVQNISPGKDWERIFVQSSAVPEEPKIILARRGRLHFYPETKRATLELFAGTVHAFNPAAPEKYSLTAFERWEDEIDVENLFGSFAGPKRVREKDIGELLEELRVIRRDLAGPGAEPAVRPAAGAAARSGEASRELAARTAYRMREARAHLVEIHKKFALPVACLIFCFLGLPLGVSTRKGGRSSGFTISLGVILVYYILITAGEKLAMDGRISAVLGMWGPNILIALAAAVLFVLALRERRLLPRGPGPRLRATAEDQDRAPSAAAARSRRRRRRLVFPIILDRYIIRKYAGILVLVVLSLLLISFIVAFFERIDKVYENGKPLGLLFRFLLYKTPEFMTFVLPIAALTTALLTIGFLTKFNEVTAMKACGISVYRMVVPVVVLAGLLGVGSLYVQERLLPSANRKAEETWNRITDAPVQSGGSLSRRWLLGRGKNRIYHYALFDPRSAAFRGLSIFDLDLERWSITRRFSAETAVLKGSDLFLTEAWRRDFEGEQQVGYDESREAVLPGVEDRAFFLKEWKDPAQMNAGELRAYVRDIADLDYEAGRFKVDLAAKMAFPFVAVVMTLLGLPFAFTMGKRGTLVGIGTSIVIAMVFWGAIGVFKSLGYVAILPAFLAAWGPNLLFGLAGLYLLFRLRT
ncbi:MAG: LptF/LptG family permease [Candidatus Aminicenantes bacterium]|nr:LptF/LptG family permease [Candidatus Aminicenantes bacterium]